MTYIYGKIKKFKFFLKIYGPKISKTVNDPFFYPPNFHEIHDFLEFFFSVTQISHSTLPIKAKVANRNAQWASQQQFKKERILLVTLYNTQ